VQTVVHAAAAHPSAFRQVMHSSWLALDMLYELFNVGRMLVDRQYHMAWVTRLLVILVTSAILTSGFWFPLAWDNWVGHLLDKLFDLLLAAVLFLALYCETKRYKEWRSKG
jgi:hypothetical protein